MAISQPSNGSATGNTLRSLLSSGTLPKTVALWFQVPNVTQAFYLACLGPSIYTGGLTLAARGDLSGDTLRFGTNATPDSSLAATSTSYSANTWHHACGVATSTTNRAVFLDGGGKGTATGLFNPTLEEIQTNFTTSTTTYYAEVAVWDAALTDAEVAILGAGVSPLLVRPQSLAFYAPLIRNILDLRGNAITTHGSTTVESHPRVILSSTGGVFKLQPQVDVVRTAANSILFGQNGDTTEVTRSVSSTIAFAQGAMPPFAELSATNSFAFSQDQIPFQDMQQSITFNSAAFTPEVVRSILQSINFKQQVKAVVGNIASGRYRR